MTERPLGLSKLFGRQPIAQSSSTTIRLRGPIEVARSDDRAAKTKRRSTRRISVRSGQPTSQTTRLRSEDDARKWIAAVAVSIETCQPRTMASSITARRKVPKASVRLILVAYGSRLVRRRPSPSRSPRCHRRWPPAATRGRLRLWLGRRPCQCLPQLREGLLVQSGEIGLSQPREPPAGRLTTGEPGEARRACQPSTGALDRA